MSFEGHLNVTASLVTITTPLSPTYLNVKIVIEKNDKFTTKSPNYTRKNSKEVKKNKFVLQKN